MIDGKRISRSAKTQNECLKKMKEAEREILTSKILGKADDSDVMDQTLQDSISTWLYDVKRPTIKKSSYFDTLDTAYRNQLMDSELGRSKLKDITPHKIQIYLNSVCEQLSSMTSLTRTFATGSKASAQEEHIMIGFIAITVNILFSNLIPNSCRTLIQRVSLSFNKMN